MPVADGAASHVGARARSRTARESTSAVAQRQSGFTLQTRRDGDVRNGASCAGSDVTRLRVSRSWRPFTVRSWASRVARREQPPPYARRSGPSISSMRSARSSGRRPLA